MALTLARIPRIKLASRARMRPIRASSPARVQSRIDGCAPSRARRLLRLGTPRIPICFVRSGDPGFARLFITLAALGVALTACSLPSSMPALPSATAEPPATASASVIRGPTTLIHPGAITFLSSTDYPRHESIANGKPVGFDIDVAQALATKIGLSAQIKSTPFELLIPSLLA